MFTNLSPELSCRLPQRVCVVAIQNAWAKLPKELEAQHGGQEYLDHSGAQYPKPYERELNVGVVQFAIQLVNLCLRLLQLTNNTESGNKFLGRVDDNGQ